MKKRNLKELIKRLHVARYNLQRVKYTAYRDDKCLALLTAFNGNDKEWRVKLQNVVRDSYRGIDETALRLRCERFDKKLLKWSSEGFVRGVRAATNDALLPIIESFV